MEQSNISAGPVKQVDNLKKVKMTPVRMAGMLFCLTAAGAFGIEDMIPLSGPGFTLVMLIIFAVIWAYPISQIVSELSAIMPSEGGIYIWVKEALGEFWGFCTSWWGIMNCYLGLSVYIVLITDYASKFIPALQDPVTRFIVQFIIVAFFVALNLKGLSDVSWVNTVFSILILLAFALVTIVGLTHWQYNPMVPFTPEGQSWVDSLGGSICIVIWMYCGYESISNMGGEIANPEVIPKGFRLVMPVIALSYILPTLAGIVSVGPWDEWATDGIGYGDVLSQCLGYGWGVGFLVVAILSQMAIFNAYIASGSRAFFVIADDHLSPKFLAKTSKKSGLPVLSIMLLAIMVVVMMNFDFTTLMIITAPLMLIVYVTLSLSLLVIRKKYPVEERNCWYIKGPKAKIYLYGILPMIITVIALLVNGTEYFLLGFVSIGSAVLFYIAFKLIYGGLYKDDPERHPINPKTRLAKGDITRFGVYILAFGLYAIVGSFFLAWYEGSWGPEYYLDLYGEGTLIGNFWLMIKVARVGGIIATVVSLILIAIGKKTDPPARGLFEVRPGDEPGK